MSQWTGFQYPRVHQIERNIMSLNEYGSILDAHQDDLLSDISEAKRQLKGIKKKRKDLDAQEADIKERIEYMEETHKLYMEMINKFGKV